MSSSSINSKYFMVTILERFTHSGRRHRFFRSHPRCSPADRPRTVSTGSDNRRAGKSAELAGNGGINGAERFTSRLGRRVHQTRSRSGRKYRAMEALLSKTIIRKAKRIPGGKPSGGPFSTEYDKPGGGGVFCMKRKREIFGISYPRKSLEICQSCFGCFSFIRLVLASTLKPIVYKVYRIRS